MNSLRKRLPSPKLVQNALLQVQAFATTSTASTEIQIPNRKERGPTDILKALENTIHRDPTAPHYKYMDDPYLIPISNFEKRSYALAKESGRKAAMWVRQEHADFFQHKNADPFIESLRPRVEYTDKSQVSEDLLLDVIKSGNFEDSSQIYKLLEGDVKIETKLALFELHCFCNSTQLIDDNLVEERWFFNSNKETLNVKWNQDPEKNNLFNTLVKEGGDIAAAAYSALICGSVKYKNGHYAFELYDECQKNEITLCKSAYDYLIKIIQFAVTSDDKRLSTLTNIYEEMAKNNIRPDINTFNASLSLASKFRETKRKVFVTIWNEFDRLDVQPSLASYAFLLECYFYHKKPEAGQSFLVEVLDKLKGQKIELKDPQDVLFFVNAMKIAFECNSLLLGKRVHELLLAHNNYSLIGDSYKENIYYRYFMLLHLNNLQFESFMKVYEEFVPNIYSPEISVFKEILKIIELQDSNIGREVLPKLFSQAVMFEFTRNQDALGQLFELMIGHCQPPPESPLHTTFAENAWTAWNILEEYKAVSKRGFNYEVQVLENIVILCLRGEEFEKMLQVLSVLINSKNIVIGLVRPQFLNEIFGACMKIGHAEGVLSLIEYSIETGMGDGLAMAREAHKTLPFTVGQENKLNTLVGKDILEVKVDNNVF